MAEKRFRSVDRIPANVYRVSALGIFLLSLYRFIFYPLSGDIGFYLSISYILLLVWGAGVSLLSPSKTKALVEGFVVLATGTSVIDFLANFGELSTGLLSSLFFIALFSIITYILYSASESKPNPNDDISVSNELSNPKKNETEYAVVLENVYKDYKVGDVVVKALRGMNLKIKKGEFVAIMGPSGSGKSTTLNLIGALDRPTKGKVYVDGVDISKLSDDELSELRNKKVGFIFQTFNLINRTTVLGNVVMPAIVSGLSKKERVEKAKWLLKLVGLENEMDRSPRFLSGGQQQRVAIARALMNDPSIILADEPTGNLDTKTGREIMEYLKKLNRELGTTVIVVTHDPDVARMADRIIYIRDGRVVGEEVLNN